MVEREQVKPLAPASNRQASDEEETATTHLKKLRRRKYIQCCGCLAALLLILAIVIIILIFTVFNVKEPVIRLNSVQLHNLNQLITAGPTTPPAANTNISLTADVSVKNPNFASFKYRNTTTILYYHGSVAGEAKSPPGLSKARRTSRMNITLDIMVDSLILNPNFQGDLISGLLPMSSYTRVGGRVKILSFIKRHVTVKMNCTMAVNITSREIQEQKCKRKVKL